LNILHITPENSFIYQIIIVVCLVSLSVISAISGVGKGVKILSNINVVSVIVLLLFVLALGPTVYLIGSFTDGLGNYINNFFNLTFNTHVYEKMHCLGSMTGLSCIGHGGFHGLPM
jgi:choline/glycine/proline betaine transport protein